MEYGPESESGPEGLYEVVLGSRPAESLRNRFPRMSVRSTGAQTALRRGVGEPGELEALIEELCLLGIRFLDIHRLPGPPGQGRGYEVRVDGEVGEPLLRYLGWSHRAVPEQSRVRIRAASGELHEFLRACTDSGASIERVRMVLPVGARQPTCS